MKLKTLIILLGIVVVAVAAGLSWRDSAKTQTTGDFKGQSVVLTVGRPVQFPDGLTVTLNEINDSRCKPDVQCIWQGELRDVILLDIELLDGSHRTGEVRLGTVNNQKVSKEGYIFELKSATETTATITVTVEIADQGGEI